MRVFRRLFILIKYLVRAIIRYKLMKITSERQCNVSFSVLCLPLWKYKRNVMSMWVLEKKMRENHTGQQ